MGMQCKRTASLAILIILLGCESIRIDSETNSTGHEHLGKHWRQRHEKMHVETPMRTSDCDCSCHCTCTEDEQCTQPNWMLGCLRNRNAELHQPANGAPKASPTPAGAAPTKASTAGRYDHHILINAPAKDFFAAIDFGSIGEITGDPSAVGARRTITGPPLPDGVKIVEEQVSREVTETKLAFSYYIINDDNPFGVKGYRGDIAVYPSSENPSQCFVTWEAKWASANEGIDGLPAGIRQAIAAGEKKASGQ